MDRKKHYQNPKIQEDLYQYEMGIELGAEIEWDKRQHLGEYQREHAHADYKGTASDLGKMSEKNRERHR